MIVTDSDMYCFLLPQVVEINVKVESAGQHNVHQNAFYAEETLLKSELQAMRDCDSLSARHWIVRAHACIPSLLTLWYDVLLIICRSTI